MKPLFYILAILAFNFDIANADESRISLTGSSTLAPLAVEIAERFESRKSNVKIDVQTGGSSRGIADTRRGLAQIGMSSRPLYPEELPGLQTHTIALDGVAFVINKSNPLNNLDKQQVVDILTGKITHWSQLESQNANSDTLGSSNDKIIVINRAKGRSELDLVSEYLKIKPREIRADIIAGENQQCLKLLAGNTNAISYLSLGTAEYEAEQGSAIKLLSFDGIAASSTNVSTKKYPIVRPLLFVTNNRLNSDTREFLNFALSNKVQDLVRGQAFVPIQ